nr:unnamed protein product [Callosobruchus chinensis]
MKLVIEQPSAQHGSAILARHDVVITSAHKICRNDVEILTIEIGTFTVTSVYKPPGKYFVFTPPQNFTSQDRKFVLGDFNSHTVTWGYADDLSIAVKGKKFEEVEIKLKEALNLIGKCYTENSLKPNPAKTQVCVFHQNPQKSYKKLKISWEGQGLEHTEKAKYLGVILDRTLTYKDYCRNTRHKVMASNSLLRKLAGSKWGASQNILRITAEALCFSTAEYACPVWRRSKHAKQVTLALNDTCRIVTGCMKPTPLYLLYQAAGFALPQDRHEAAQYAERFKRIFDDKHLLYSLEEPHGTSRLKSRKRFMRSTSIEPPANIPLKQGPPRGMELVLHPLNPTYLDGE